MNILHIISNMDPETGGVSQAVSTMIKGLSALKTDNAVVCLNRPDSPFLKQMEFPVFALGEGKTAWNFNNRLPRWLKANLVRYDAAILHGLWQYQTYALLNSFRHTDRTDLFVMPHGMLDPYFQRAPERKLKALRNRLVWHLIEQRVFDRANGVLFTCETEMLLARETFKRYRPRREWVVGLGVGAPPPSDETALNEFLSAFPQLSGPGYLLYLGRIHPKKGIDMLIDAYLKLKREGRVELPDLVVAGPGLDTGYGIEIRQQAAVDSAIVFTGMLEGSLKWAAFHGCSAFILPSHQENFGVAVVEALACGKPVLITNQINIWREIYREGAGLVCSDNPESVTDLLVRWLELDDSRRKWMEEMARQAYLEYFTVEAAAKRLKNTICQINDAS